MLNWTPLHFAAQKGHLRVVECLINQNADINPKNKDGNTPVGVASENVIIFLKNRGIYNSTED